MSGFTCSSSVKSVPAAGAEEIISLMQRPKRRCSSMLWNMESITRQNTPSSRCPNIVLHLDPARSGQESEEYSACASPSL